MEIIYKQRNIVDAIAEVLLEYEKINKRDRTHYRDIHRRLEGRISWRKFQEYMEYMVNEKLLHRHDPTGKRGSKVYFSLTDKARRKHHLKLLGADEQVQKRKGLYQLLIFFEAFKRRDFISERQLRWLLRIIGSSYKDLKVLEENTLFYVRGRGFPTTVFKPIKGVEVVRINQPNYKEKPIPPYYYTVLRGFSVEEFTHYLKLLKKGKAPRPFSKYPFISYLEIPFISYTDYTEEEIADAINLLKDDGLIKPINEIIPGEARFNIADESLRGLIHAVWLVHILDFQILIGSLLCNSKLTEQKKRYLTLFFGERGADKVLAFAYHIRKSHRNKSGNDKKELNDDLEQGRRFIIQDIITKYKEVIGRDKFIRELIERICSEPILSQESPDMKNK